MNDEVKSRRFAAGGLAGTLPQQIGVMSPILVGLDGVRRMGKEPRQLHRRQRAAV